MKRFLFRLACVVFFVAAGPLQAQSAGKGYIELTSAPKPAARGEVIEFFIYACPHCAGFHAQVEAWRKRLPAGTVYRRVPVAFRQDLAPHVQMYYALESIGRADDVHAKLFDAIWDKKMPLRQPEEQADFLAKLGVDRKRYLDALQSFQVQAKVRESAKMVHTYKLDSVPALAINGRYLTGVAIAGTNTEALRVAEQLLAGQTVQRGRPADDAPVPGGGGSSN